MGSIRYLCFLCIDLPLAQKSYGLAVIRNCIFQRSGCGWGADKPVLGDSYFFGFAYGGVGGTFPVFVHDDAAVLGI